MTAAPAAFRCRFRCPVCGADSFQTDGDRGRCLGYKTRAFGPGGRTWAWVYAGCGFTWDRRQDERHFVVQVEDPNGFAAGI